MYISWPVEPVGYVGVTNDLVRRVSEHKAGTASRFTGRYGITRLVCVESTGSVHDAIAREKQIKGGYVVRRLR